MSADTLDKPVLPRSDSSTTRHSVKRPRPGRNAFLGNIWKSPPIVATDEISCLPLTSPDPWWPSRRWPFRCPVPGQIPQFREVVGLGYLLLALGTKEHPGKRTSSCFQVWLSGLPCIFLKERPRTLVMVVAPANISPVPSTWSLPLR